jgi:hypothetical protein
MGPRPHQMRGQGGRARPIPPARKHANADSRGQGGRARPILPSWKHANAASRGQGGRARPDTAGGEARQRSEGLASHAISRSSGTAELSRKSSVGSVCGARRRAPTGDSKRQALARLRPPQESGPAGGRSGEPYPRRPIVDQPHPDGSEDNSARGACSGSVAHSGSARHLWPRRSRSPHKVWA